MSPTSAPGADTVLFDLGGVLIDWNPRYLYAGHFPDAAAMEDFLARVCPPEWNHEMDAGKPFDTAVAERQALFPECAGLIALWRDGWPRMLGGALEETVRILGSLRGRYRLLALTNWSAETFPVARERFEFLGWFEAIVVSGEAGLAKPDPRIFELTRRRTGLDPGRTVFIDDSPANIATARSLGYAACRFESAEFLRTQLAGLGVQAG